jgi:lysophospholipase L1-like esterase
MRRASILGLLVASLSAACSVPDEPNPEPPGPVAAGKSSKTGSPGKFTLALGDSYVFGLQPGKDANDAAAFNTGLATLFVARLNAGKDRARAREVNLSCPGESTETFRAGGCLWSEDFGFPLHVAYDGTQLAAALRFLRQHPGEVDPIILSLGTNDVGVPFVFECGEDEACIAARLPRILEHATINSERILRQLRALAPDATILVLVGYRITSFPRVVKRGMDSVFRGLRVAARAHDAVLVESNPIIRSDPCRFTFICAEPDFHPTDEGHQALADALWAASDFGD